MTGSRIASAVILAVAMVAGAGRAIADERVDVELVLAVDVSGSMRRDELTAQRDGYVAAFRSPEVIAAIREGAYGKVAVTYVEWAHSELVRVVAPWTLIDGPESAEAFAAQLEEAPISNMRRTSISGAIRYSAAAFVDSGFAGDRRVIDVSGDGPNNQGGPVTDARDLAVAAGITINGLPLTIEPWLAGLGLGVPALDVYYRQCVIGGPGSFVLPVASWDQFPEAVRRKLVLELSWNAPDGPPVMKAQFLDMPKVDCQIGEKLGLVNQN